MKIYAILNDNIISKIIETDIRHTASNFKDITNISPPPEVGWVYNIVDNLYVPSTDFTYAKNKISKIPTRIAVQKINLILSDTNQRNSLYTLYKHGKKSKSSLTADEKAEIQDLESKWDKIETIRTASNQIEAEINNLQTIEEVQAYDIATNTLWPK